MRLLVTGGAGFIGSAFVRHAVREGADVAVADKLTYAGDLDRLKEVAGNIGVYKADVSDSGGMGDVFSQERPDAVVHFAAETHVDRSILYPREFFTSNVLGTLTLLEHSVKHGTGSFIHVSTDEVYGELPASPDITFREGDPLLPNSPYSASKAGADLVVRAFSKTYGLRAVVVRPTNNYGPWQYPEKLIPLSIARVLGGEKIPVYGKGENIRTWLYVDDCARAVFTLLQKGGDGEIYNLGSGEEMRNMDLIRSLLKILGKGEEMIEFVPDRPGHDFRYAVDTKKVEREAGWRPSITIEEGLQRTVGWYLEHKDWLFAKQKEAEAFVTSLKSQYNAMGPRG